MGRRKHNDDKKNSIEETKNHKRMVGQILFGIIGELKERAHSHDGSKVKEPELSLFSEFGPQLKKLEYGSDEYKAALSEMGKGVEHHYVHNRHHPEHFKNGIKGMNIIDLVEMICDWKAASLRMKRGRFSKSIDINRTRFSIDEDLISIIKNTAELLDKFSK